MLWAGTLTYDTEKIGEDNRSMCKKCRFDWKTCENREIRMEYQGKVISAAPIDKEGFPILVYCMYFEEKPYSNA